MKLGSRGEMRVMKRVVHALYVRQDSHLLICSETVP